MATNYVRARGKDAPVDLDLNNTEEPLAGPDDPLQTAPLAAASVTESIHLLDPALIRVPAAPNRDNASFDAESSDELRRSIVASGGNLQAIQVRRIDEPDGSELYELVFGERRLRACREAGLKVRAVITQHAAAERDPLDRLSENRARKELSPIEFGRQLKHLIDGPYGLTQAQLAERIGCNRSQISRAYELASLAPEILSAFQTSTELRYEDMLPLRRAYKANPKAVVEEAQRVQAEPESASTREVVKRLIQAGAEERVASCNTPPEALDPQPLTCDGRTIGSWRVSAQGSVEVSIGTSMSDLQRQALLNHVAGYIGRTVLKQSAKKAATKAATTPTVQVESA